MRRLYSGSEHAVAELYDQFGNQVFQMVLSAKQHNKLKDIDPDEAVTDAFVRMYKQSGQYNPDIPLEKWVQQQTSLCIAHKLKAKSSPIGFWARVAEFARQLQRAG